MAVPPPPSSPEKLIAILERERQDFIMVTSYTRKTSRWSKGRLHSVGDGIVFIFPTNMPNVHHLNLEEISLPVDKSEFRDIYTVPEELFLEAKVRRHPFVLETSVTKEYRSKLDQASEVLMTMNQDCARCVIERECIIFGLIMILKQWDAEQLFRVVDRLMSYVVDVGTLSDFHKSCRFYIKIIMTVCTDSLSVVQFFEKVCTFSHVKGCRFLADLRNKQFAFFCWHLKRMDAEFSQSIIEAKWLLNEDCLENAVLRGDVESLKSALELDWPSRLLPYTISQEPDSDPSENLWPREKAGLKVRGFNSCEYYAYLTTALFKGSIYTRLNEGFRNCCHLLWQSIPTPHLPIQNMREYILRKSPIEEDIELNEVIPNFWSLFTNYFEENFPPVFKPRSLKQLARCAVRRRCRSPKQTALLPLPEPLIKYVNLEF